MMSTSHKHDNTHSTFFVSRHCRPGQLDAERLCNISNLTLFYFVIYFLSLIACYQFIEVSVYKLL